jgi:CHAT domain-containing protein/Tfp pilus assembly protein PilF
VEFLPKTEKEALIMQSSSRLLRTIAVCLLVLAAELPLLAQQERWKELNDRTAELFQQGKYAEAIGVGEEAVRVAEATFGPDYPYVATSLTNLGVLYKTVGDYVRAEPLLRRAVAINEKFLGPNSLQVGTSVNNLAQLYSAQGHYAQAEPLLRRAITIWEKELGPHDPQVAIGLNNLGMALHAQANYAGAEPVFNRAIAILEKALGPDHPNVAVGLNNLASLYKDQGLHAQAEPLFRRALAIVERALGRDRLEVATVLNNLAEVYLVEGNYAHAEPLYQRSLAINERVLGPDHPAVATNLNNLALLYVRQGNSARAEPLYQRALAIRERFLGPEHTDTATNLNNLARLYQDQGNYARAEPLYKRGLAAKEKTLGPNHPDVAVSLNNLAALYVDRGEHSRAEPLYQRALVIQEKALGPNHPTVATSINNLAVLYDHRGDYGRAEPLYRRALSVSEKAFGPDHPEVARGLINLASLYYARREPDKAASMFDRSLENVGRQFEHHFGYMSENERLLFLDTVSFLFSGYFSFCFTYREQKPELLGRMYDVALWQKGFVGQSVAALRAQIAAGGDPEALRLLEELTAKKTQLAKLLQATPEDPPPWRQRVEQLEKEANELERELVRRSTALAEQKQLQRVTWRDVQKALKEGEAAVEFLRFQYHDGKRWTDKTYYVALIVTPDTAAAPTLVIFGEADKLEGAPVAAFREWVEPEGAVTPGTEQRLYSALWQPLESALGDARRVYLSPDGVLNLIAWDVLPAAPSAGPLSDDRLLADRYDLRVLSSTRDLLRPAHSADSRSAVLVGNPRFNLDETKQLAAARTLEKREQQMLARGRRSRDQQGETLSPLPGTQAELEALQKLLEANRWQAEAYSEEQALEEVVKRVRAPRILHLATHGFFLPDQAVEPKESSVAIGPATPSRREDPMLRSGLFFAGAERTLAGRAPPADLDDGILTAYEATGLNLHGTELVVLSACQTGLGEVRNGEGVFGLRRALEVAGAQSILMSLWPVPDRETQELMTLFYENWLAGKSKHDALRAAQQELRARVKERYGADRPFFWGAFVLVGPERTP